MEDNVTWEPLQNHTFVTSMTCENGCACSTDQPTPSGHPEGDWNPTSINLLCDDPHHAVHDTVTLPGADTIDLSGRDWCTQHAEHQYSIVVYHCPDGCCDRLVHTRCVCGAEWDEGAT